MHDLLLHAIATIALLTGNALLIGLGFIIARWSSASPPESGREEAPNLHQDLKGVTLALAAMGERLLKLEVQIGQLREQAGQEGLPLNRDPEQKSFKIATKLALQGAGADEIVELCGLTRGEADLICMLHANNQVSASSMAGDLARLASRVTDLPQINPTDDPRSRR
ncbi:MAG: DUF2802 domain-containing protein [Candidatus Contendobacter sp.]|jgi:hypothetical protein|nr:DUF2802 domain-containing protein [Gammaproteobacteria bacterium]MCC8992823.1 DUF2802 domain-containing protein [Candidatus Contendobacter sp.]